MVSHQLGSPSVGSIVEPRPPGGDIIYACCVVAAVMKKAAKEQEKMISQRCKLLHHTIKAAAIVMWPLWGPTPGNKEYNNQLTYYATGISH